MNCKNCNTELNSKFCPNCGQPSNLKRIDGKYIIHEIENVQLNLDAVGTCYITINGYDQNGNLVFSTVLQINDVASAAQCDQIADQIAAMLN